MIGAGLARLEACCALALVCRLVLAGKVVVVLGPGTGGGAGSRHAWFARDTAATPPMVFVAVARARGMFRAPARARCTLFGGERDWGRLAGEDTRKFGGEIDPRLAGEL